MINIIKFANFLLMSLMFFLIFFVLIDTSDKNSSSIVKVNEFISFDKDLSNEEDRIVKYFLSVPKDQYLSKYKEIAESIRDILHTEKGAKIGIEILESIKSNINNNAHAKMYLLLKISTLKRLSNDLNGMLESAFEYLSLAKINADEYQIAVGIVNLASMLSFFNGYDLSNSLLEEISPSLEFKDYKWNRLKIRSLLTMAESEIAIGNYESSINILNELIDNGDRIPSNEWDDYYSYILAMKADIAMYYNKNDEAKEYLEKSNYILKNDNYNVLVDKYIVIKTIELKWAVKNNLNVDEKLKDIILYHNDASVISYRYVRMFYESLFNYYVNIKDYKKYHELRLKYLSKIEDIMKLSYSLIYKNSVVINNNDILNNERESLIKKLKYSLLTIIIITLFLILTFIKYILINSENFNDALTEIGNRKKFNREIKKIKSKKYFLSIIDIDNFKSINDTYGHDVGDHVLKRLSGAISNLLPSNAEIYRIGGEEFAIIFKKSSTKEVADSMDYIRGKVEKLKWNNIGQVTISAGIACSTNGDDIYKRADKLLYQSKFSGKNRISIETNEI